MNKIKILSAALLLLFLANAYSQQPKPEDKIAAIVGNNIITWSDLLYQMTVYAKQNHIPQLNAAVEQQVLLSMIADKLMLAKADQDSITAPDDDVQKQLDYRIKALIKEFGSEKNLEEANDMTMPKIREFIRQNIIQQIKIEKLKQQKFGNGIRITKQQVVNFYEQYKDSLPEVPKTYEVYQIVRRPALTLEAKRLAYEKAKSILDSIKNGADFAVMAEKYSDDTLSAHNGGEVDKIKKGSTIKEYEDAAFLLKPGEVSDVVETPQGYFIIKLLNKSGDIIDVRQILIKFPRLESADFETINFLKNLKEQAANGEKSFQELALQNSQDAATSRDSGYVGKIPLSPATMDSSEISMLKSLKAGDISDPVRLGEDPDYAYYLFYVKAIYSEHKPTLENDYPLIQRFAQNYEENKQLNEWLDELRKTIYVDIKL